MHLVICCGKGDVEQKRPEHLVQEGSFSLRSCVAEGWIHIPTRLVMGDQSWPFGHYLKPPKEEKTEGSNACTCHLGDYSSASSLSQPHLQMLPGIDGFWHAHQATDSDRCS